MNTHQEIGDREISAIPSNNEKGMSFKIGDMKCIARTLGFSESLDNLVKNLYDNKNINISTSPTCRHMFGAHMDLLC